MQSFLQYRRFRRHVQAQYERDREKARAIGQEKNHDRSKSTSPDSSTVAHAAGDSPIEDRRDPEKGEQATSRGSEGCEVPASAEHAFESHHSMQPVNTTDTRSDMTSTSHAATQGSMGTNLGTALTGINVRDRTTQEGRSDTTVHGNKIFVVGYEGDRDPLNPHNWSYGTRIWATVNIAFIGWIVGFASSVDSAALVQASEDFGVSEVVESLATGLFLVGFGTGALFAGPISETVGRNPVYIATLSLYMIFIMASALAPKIGAQLVFRFIAGFFGSTPLTCAGGSISDLWSPLERVYAFPVFANAAFMGPIFGPMVGGFIGESKLVSWRWTEWVTLIISGLILTSIVFLQPETYAPILLKWKAAHLRSLTGDERYRAEVEIREDNIWLRLKRAMYRPFILTFQEPVIMLLALYLTVIYIILFTFLNGYTFIFTETYGFSEGITGLSFIGIGVGLCLASLLVPFIYRFARKDLAKIKAQGGTRLPPEFRLWFAMLGAPAIPVSLFWMGWTARPSISYWSPLVASVLFGYGILCVFISSYQYIIDSYETYSASALASVTLIRYVAAGGSVEYAIPFYTNLGVPWTCTILGAISALCVPLPYLFFVFGPKIRNRSKYAVV
ncbi:hypothetical protein XANCAGTX0491_009245 [Xanthoria calcicola]